MTLADAPFLALPLYRRFSSALPCRLSFDETELRSFARPRDSSPEVMPEEGTGACKSLETVSPSKALYHYDIRRPSR